MSYHVQDPKAPGLMTASWPCWNEDADSLSGWQVGDGREAAKEHLLLPQGNWPDSSVVLGLPVPGAPSSMDFNACRNPPTICALCIERDSVEFSAALLGTRSLGRGFKDLPPAAALPDCRAIKGLAPECSLLPPVSVPTPAWDLCETEQRSSTGPPNLHSWGNVLPGVCQQLALCSVAGASPGWCSPRGCGSLCAPEPPAWGILALQGLYRGSCVNIKAQGGGGEEP